MLITNCVNAQGNWSKWQKAPGEANLEWRWRFAIYNKGYYYYGVEVQNLHSDKDVFVTLSFFGENTREQSFCEPEVIKLKRNETIELRVWTKDSVKKPAALFNVVQAVDKKKK